MDAGAPGLSVVWRLDVACISEVISQWQAHCLLLSVSVIRGSPVYLVSRSV